MRSLSDEKLGEALWARSKDFGERGDFYNAIIDLGAAYRLLSLAHDVRTEAVRLDWEKCYHQLVSSDAISKEESNGNEKADLLSTLISRVQERKR